MMRCVPLACALSLSAAAPAAATSLVITGDGRPRVPSQYLDVETARTLPDGANTLSLGAGWYYPTGTLTYTRGMAGGELALNVGYQVFVLGSVPAGVSPASGRVSGAIGYKRGLGWLGPWDGAIAVQGMAGYGASTFGAQVMLPLDAQFGPGVLTLSPHVAVPDVTTTPSTLLVGAIAGYDWPLGGGFTFFASAGADWRPLYNPYDPFLFSLQAGLRYAVTPAFAVDAQAGLPQGGRYPANYTQPQNGLASLTVRYGF